MSLSGLNSIFTNDLVVLFLIISLGYIIGRVRVKEIGFGTAGILIIALIFGHFGFEVPSIIQNVGLVCFVTTVGFIAGPTFFHNFKGKAILYVINGAAIIVSSALTCILIILITGTPTDLALGLLAGALTTTPGLAAGLEVTGSDMVSVGYGIAYPFGVVGVVLFVQVIPKLIDSDYKTEEKWGPVNEVPFTLSHRVSGKIIKIDTNGLFSFSLAILLGYFIGQVKVPLPGQGSFSLGSSGGPLLVGILLGHFGTICHLDMRVKKESIIMIRELGLAFFLVGAGTNAGKGFVEVLVQQGPLLFLYGALMTVIPLAVGFLISKKIVRLSTLDSMGSICGGMTSTPALGTLITSTGTDEVTNSYAATYPVALVMIVVLVELIGGIML